MGPHHKKLLDRYRKAIETWVGCCTNADVLLLPPLNPSPDVQPLVRAKMIDEFVGALTVAENARYDAAQILHQLCEDFNVPFRQLRVQKWILSPTTQDDFGGEKLLLSRGPYTKRDRFLAGYEWWRLPCP